MRATTPTDRALRVAIDVGPLHGHRTGVGAAVAGLLAELEDRDDLELRPYVTSTRARLTPPQRRLPIPAALAHRLWGRSSWPPADRWLGHPDVVHGTNYVVPPARCPRVVSVYDCWFLEHPELAGGDVHRAGRALRRAVEAGAHVVTSSHASADRARRLLATDRVRAIHLGPPPPAPPAEPSTVDGRRLVERLTGRCFVLALGTVERRKNVPALVSAFGRLADADREVLLVVAGADGDDADAVAQRLRSLDTGAAARVIRAVRVDAGLKAWLLGHAAVLAYPSLDEGFGFPLLEAQQARTPVVASDAGSIPEVAGDGALLGPPGDVEGLADRLHTVLTDGSTRDSLVERGAANVTRFSWRVTGDSYVELYRELAGSDR